MNNKKNKILFIATLLPPYSGSANIRGLNYINYIHKLGHQVDVITVDYPKDSLQYDHSLENAFHKDISIYRIDPGKFYRLLYQRKPASSAPIKESVQKKKSIKPIINNIIREKILVLDSYIQWIQPAFNQGVKLIETTDYDYMFTMHETPSSHMVGYKLKKKFPHLNWIGYWSDPWNDDSLRQNRSILNKSIEEILEKRVVEKVDKLLFTSEGTKEMYINKYQLKESKTDIVYRGYEEEGYKDILLHKDIPVDFQKDKINVVHTGTIYKQLRDITPLCRALDELKAKNPEVFQQYHFIFLGKIDNEEDMLRLSSFENVTVKGQVSYEKAMEYLVFADVLLLYGNKNSTQIPGKVYEYLGSKALILSILGDSNDPLIPLLEQVRKGPIIQNTNIYIVKTLIQLKDIKNKNTNSDWNNKAVEEFKWDKVVEDLVEKFNVEKGRK